MKHLRTRIWPIGLVMLITSLSLPPVLAHAVTPQTIVIDGVNDFDPGNLLDDDTGDTEIKNWCTDDPEVDAPMDLGQIFVTNDANNLYIGFEYFRDCFSSPQVNLGIAFSYGTPGDGGTTDPFSRKIAWNTIVNKPDNVLYDVIDGFNYEVLYHWNGTSWDNISSTVNPGWGSGSNGLGIVDDTGFEELSLPLSVFGVAPGGTINIEIWMTQDGTSKPPLDAMASDDVQTSTPSGTVFDVTTAVEMTATLPYVVQSAVDNPPVLNQAIRTAPAQLQLTFNEPIDAVTGGNPVHYTVGGGETAATVTGAVVDAGVPSIVHLTLSNDIAEAGTAYFVIVTGVQDLGGNEIIYDNVGNVKCFAVKSVTFEGKFGPYLQTNSMPPDGFTVEGSKFPLSFDLCDGADMVQVDAINEIWQYTTLFSFPVQCSDSSGSLTVEWKFNHNCGDWETVGNRSFTLNIASPATQTFSHFWDDLDPTSFTDKAIDVIFRVDMSAFSPIQGVDDVGLAGSELPLSFTAPFATMVDDGTGQDETAGDYVYTGVASFPAGTLKNVGYKFTLNGSFECPETGNRDVYLDDTLYDTIGGLKGPLALRLAYFNRCYVIGHDVKVVFSVDVGQSSVAGSGGALDVRLAGSQSPLDWDPALAPGMHDDGIGFDAVAGDDIYTLAVTFVDSTNYYLEYKYTVGDVFEGQDQPNRSMIILDNFDAGQNPQVLPLDQLHHTVATAAPNVVPGIRTHLLAAWPNPFNPRTTLQFEVASRSRVNLAIYDARGRLVSQLLDSVQSPGRHELQWNGMSDTGSPVSSGVYYVRLLADGSADGLKLVLLK